MLKIVFIDIDNTLLDFNKCAEEAMKKILLSNGIIFQSYMFDVFNEINDSLWLEIEKGKLTKKGLYEKRWNMIFKQLDIHIDGVFFEKQFIKQLEESAVPIEYAKELLKYLSSKYSVYAASNAPYLQQVKRLKKAGMIQYIKEIFASESIGFLKPDKNFFDECFAHLPSIQPSEAIIIGDSLSADISGGISYGMQTCWFNYKHSSLPENIKPDYIVSKLEEIVDLI